MTSGVEAVIVCPDARRDRAVPNAFGGLVRVVWASSGRRPRHLVPAAVAGVGAVATRALFGR